MNLKTAKNLFVMLLLLMPFLVSAQEDYTKYEALYPGCVDDAGSTIYYPNKWPADLELPVFPGGDIELTRFVNQNIEYPDVVDSVTVDSLGNETQHRAKGVVLVGFYVDRCGRTRNHQIVQSVNEAYDKEALRIMENLPVFKPGALYGERVKVGLIVPVHFTRSQMPKNPNEEEYYYEEGEEYYYDESYY